MSRSQITFTLGQGTITNPATGTDYISGIHFYGTGPGSFGTTACQAVFSLSDAENKGIKNDYADETKAIGTIEWGTGLSLGTLAAGDVITVTVAEKGPNGTTANVIICTYTASAADVADHTGDTLNTSITAAINTQSYTTAIAGVGYTASYSGYPAAATTNITTLTARAGLGLNLNGTNAAATFSNGHTMTNAVTPFTGGAYSKKAIWHYHVSEFFRANPTSKLWVRFANLPASDYSDVTALQSAANGECMRIGIYSFVAKTAGAAGTIVSDLGLLQTQANGLFAAYQPVAMFFAPNIAAVNDISTLANLQSAASAQNCYCVVSQDGAAAGAQLFVNSGVSISNIGCILGTSSKASVSQDIGEVGAFNITNGVEMNVPAFSNGVLVSSVAGSLLDTLDAYRYGFCVNQTGYPGTFINNDWTAIANTNAYNRLGRILTINKVERQQYIALLPLLKSRIYLNADGTMTQTTIEQYIGAAEPRIAQMVKDGDLSPGNMTGTSLTKGVVSIDPTQNVNSQGYVAIVYNILGVSIADNINVTLQFTQSLG